MNPLVDALNHRINQLLKRSPSVTGSWVEGWTIPSNVVDLSSGTIYQRAAGDNVWLTWEEFAELFALIQKRDAVLSRTTGGQ